MGAPNTNDFLQIGKLNTTGEGAPVITATVAFCNLGSNLPATGIVPLGWATVLDDPYGMVQAVPCATALVPGALSAFKVPESGIYDVRAYITAATSAGTTGVRIYIGYTSSPGSLVSNAITGLNILTQGISSVGASFISACFAEAWGVYIPKGASVVFYLQNFSGAGTISTDQTLATTSQASIRLVRPCSQPGTYL